MDCICKSMKWRRSLFFKEREVKTIIQFNIISEDCGFDKLFSEEHHILELCQHIGNRVHYTSPKTRRLKIGIEKVVRLFVHANEH